MAPRIKLLIVEARAAYVQTVRDSLKTTQLPLNCTIYQAASLSGAKAYVKQLAFDAVVSSLTLPNSEPTAVYQYLATAVPQVPIILICEPEQADIARQAIQQGAADYLFSGELTSSRLPRAIENALARCRQPDEPLTPAQAPLQHQIDQLRDQNDALTQFNATMAHQVQGILSQIIGYGSLIEIDENSTLSQESKHSLNRILQSAHKINNVTNELMLLSSLRRDDVDIIPVAMDRVLTEVFKRLQFKVEDANGRIQTPKQWPTALGQPAWLEEVWFNYLSNGLKYGGNPPILTLGADQQPDDMIRFWVKDNGRGIAPEDQERLFKPHSRLLEPRVSGQGLGLAIVQRIIRKCGGGVGVESEPGQGSTFWFTLPAAPDDNTLAQGQHE